MTNHGLLLRALRRGMTLLADFAYGIDAGNAIRHGLPAPRRDPGAPRSARPAPGRSSADVTHQCREERAQITPGRRGASTPGCVVDADVRRSSAA